ncbi:MAG: HAD family hydrolase [Firmicutes bacterium]|nr:HAD family hydrolase [Bacillota bacterium]
MNKPWITFDLDGTLLHNPYWRLHLAPWIHAQASHRGVEWLQIWQPLSQEGNRRWQKGNWSGAYDWADIVKTVYGLSLPHPQTVPWDSIASLTLPGVLWMLSALSTLPVRLGIITNGLWANQEPYLKSLHWDTIFETIVTTDFKSVCKPDPAVFLAFPGPVLCHVGDRMFHDVLVAKRARTIAVLYQSKQTAEGRYDPVSPSQLVPDHIIRDYWSFPDLIQNFLSNNPPTTQNFESFGPTLNPCKFPLC